MLCIAGVTWAYVWWRETGQTRALVAFSLFSIALIYTNHLGWAILGALGVHSLLSRPDLRLFRHAIAAGCSILLSFLPILRAFLHEPRRPGSGWYPSRAEHGLPGPWVVMACANPGARAASEGFPDRGVAPRSCG